MPRSPDRSLPRAVLALMAVGAVVFAATGAFVVAPALFPRKPGEFAVAPVIVTTVMGMLGSLVGAGLGRRLTGLK